MRPGFSPLRAHPVHVLQPNHQPSDRPIRRPSGRPPAASGLSGAKSRDGALDTPTLLGAVYTAPYFHDGSLATLLSVSEWFNKQFNLGLSKRDVQNLTEYLEVVGSGTEAYEDSIYYLDAEMEEFFFFLSAYEFLKDKNKVEPMNLTFRTVGSEIRNHKWELQDMSFLPVMNRLADIMDQAVTENDANNLEEVDLKVAEYRKLYNDNVDNLK